VWQWHVAFFDDHEETSSGAHTAAITTRLRRNHLTIVRQTLSDSHDTTVMRLRRGIFHILGGTGPESVARCGPGNTLRGLLKATPRRVRSAS